MSDAKQVTFSTSGCSFMHNYTLSLFIHCHKCATIFLLRLCQYMCVCMRNIRPSSLTFCCQNEAMTSTKTQNPVFSRMTLAVFEDSGYVDVETCQVYVLS